MGGVLQISQKIERGDLDLFLVQPRSALWRLLVDGFNLSVIGDVLFACGMFVFVCITQGWIYLIVIPFTAFFASIGMLMMATCVQLLGFWFKRFDRAAWNFFWALESPGLYPQTAIIGGLRIFLLTVVPSVWVVTYPYSFVQSHAWKFLGLVILFDIFTTFMAIILFRFGVREYESGNLVRVNR